MKTASRQYKSSMASQLRNRSYVNISFGNIDVTAGTDGVWEGSSLDWSKYPSIDYDHIYPTTVATLELNRWSLDGTQVILTPNGGEYGWISAEMSDINGNTGSYAAIDSARIDEGILAPSSGGSGDGSFGMTRSFAKNHALSGLTFTFDKNTNEWPLEGTLKFTSEDETEEYIDFTPENVVTAVSLVNETTKNVSVSFSKMLPYRRLRIQTTIWGVGNIYKNENFLSVSESNDVDPLSRRLPAEKLSFTILDYEHYYDPDNPNGVYSVINRGAPITIAYGYALDDGSIEWLASDTYALENKPVFKNSQVTFTGTGLLATMTNIYYKGVLGETDFYSLAEDVLRDANLTPTPSGDDPWDIDESLRNMVTTSPMPIQNHAACLQMIAHACGCRLFTDENNIIHIKPFGVTPVGVFSGEFSDNGHLWYSSWGNVDYGVDAENTYATLELNRWILGSPQIIAGPDTIANGYVSSQMSDESGAISSTWTKTFEVVHDIPRIVISFDNVMDEYPDTIIVRYYDRHDNLIYTKTDHPDGDTYTVESEVEDCMYFTVETTVTKIPYRRSRVTKTAYYETDFSLTRDSVKQGTPQTSKIEKLKNITVASYSYVPSAQPVEYEGSVDISTFTNVQSETYRATKLYEGYTTETSLHVEYQMARDVKVNVIGGSIISQNLYACAADLTLSAGTKYVLIEGVTLSETSEIYTYPYGTSGEDDIEENVLISNKDMADALAAHVGEYLTLRNTYDAVYRGNPELEVGDIISAETMYNNVVYGIVLVDEINFNGSLSGKLKVKGLA